MIGCGFICFTVLEYYVFADIPAAIAGFICTVFSFGVSFIVSKLDELVSIRMIESRLINKFFEIEEPLESGNPARHDKKLIERQRKGLKKLKKLV